MNDLLRWFRLKCQQIRNRRVSVSVLEVCELLGIQPNHVSATRLKLYRRYTRPPVRVILGFSDDGQLRILGYLRPTPAFVRHLLSERHANFGDLRGIDIKLSATEDGMFDIPRDDLNAEDEHPEFLVSKIKPGRMSLKERKLMRRFAAVMNHRSAGFKANAMGVWAVPEDRLDEIAVTEKK
jgi:hypothetical protein